MESTLLILQQQQELMIKQNDVIVDGLNISVEGDQVIIENQQLLGMLYSNMQYMLLIQTFSLVLVVMALAALVCYVEKLTKTSEVEQCEKDAANGAYVVMDA